MNATSSITPISESPKQPQQRQTAKDIIAANVKSLIEQLEAGHSHALTAYLDAMSRFHNYSFGNTLELARQKPDATRVAGFWKWKKEFGRSVKKGEKGIRILAPIVGIKRKPDAEAQKDVTKQNVPMVVGFRATVSRRVKRHSSWLKCLIRLANSQLDRLSLRHALSAVSQGGNLEITSILPIGKFNPQEAGEERRRLGVSVLRGHGYWRESTKGSLHRHDRYVQDRSSGQKRRRSDSPQTQR